MDRKNVRMSKKKILSRRKVLFSLVGFLMFGLVLFQIDLQEILMNIPSMKICIKNLNFLNKIIKKYDVIIAVIFICIVICFVKKHMTVSVPKISIAGIEIHLKDIDDIVKTNTINFLNTKRSLFVIYYQYDNFDDVLDSYYKIYCFLRKQLSYFENISAEKSETYLIIEKMMKKLNVFLTQNQTDYRRWYKFENAKGYKEIAVLQAEYPKYKNLRRAFEKLNLEMTECAVKLGISIEKWESEEEVTVERG